MIRSPGTQIQQSICSVDQVIIFKFTDIRFQPWEICQDDKHLSNTSLLKTLESQVGALDQGEGGNVVPPVGLRLDQFGSFFAQTSPHFHRLHLLWLHPCIRRQRPTQDGRTHLWTQKGH